MKFFKRLFYFSYKVKDYKSFAFAIIFYMAINMVLGLVGYLSGFVPYVGSVLFVLFGVLSSLYALIGVILSFVALIKK